MAPPRKSSPTSAIRKKSSVKPPSMIVTLKLSPKHLCKFHESTTMVVTKEEPSPSKIVSTTTPVKSEDDGTIQEPDSNNSNTPDAASMPPPKKGLKRDLDEAIKVRGKPGPKKRPRREDGTIDHSIPPKTNGGVVKGASNPRHNTGAINAGLRALDRTGTPCRKWARGGFKLKSFTGVLWELPRWKAPPKVFHINGGTKGSNSNDSSSKEDKDGSQVESEKSKDIPKAEDDKTSTPSQTIDSPTPMVTTVS